MNTMNNIEGDLTSNQLVVFNDLIIAFYEQYDPSKCLRLGQSLFNYFYGSIFKGSYPELFYCIDNDKAEKMFKTCLYEYVKERA